ncbi:hypothetical protein L208DRAFT_1293044 [Tricholoma matsutake]|nr:hypothetical protein L208DRAFT_1293044 [Tricholoma matsutake 945]
MVVWDVQTHWNYTHTMIRHAQLLQDAIDQWTFETPELHGFMLRSGDWQLLGKIADLLEVSRLSTIFIHHA